MRPSGDQVQLGSENRVEVGGEEPTQRKILIVEDNPINQKVAIGILRKAGFLCQVVNNGQEAVEAYCSSQFDLVLMDCQMPIMDGFDATRAIRHFEEDHDRLLRTPIVALTANAYQEIHDRCFESGMDAFLTKPVRAEVLIGLVRRLLAHQQKVA